MTREAVLDKTTAIVALCLERMLDTLSGQSFGISMFDIILRQFGPQIREGLPRLAYLLPDMLHEEDIQRLEKIYTEAG